jgi:hypothetical protein
MSDSAINVINPWRIDKAAGHDRYRFTNLVDHAAWQVVIQHLDDDSIAVPGHVSYARGSFEETLQHPGRYRLTWQITPSLLPSKDAAGPRLDPQSATFTVPWEGGCGLAVSETC